jgi:hypothetical protein
VDGALRLWVKKPTLNAAGSSLPENMRGNTIAVKNVRGIQDSDVPGAAATRHQYLPMQSKKEASNPLVPCRAPGSSSNPSIVSQ